MQTRFCKTSILINALGLVILGLTFTNCGTNTKQEKISGKEIFNTNCSACHTIGGGQKFGPNLIGVTNKRDRDWLHKFIRSSHKLIKKGDEQAKVIYEDFGKKRMPDHHHLSEEEIDAILAYIEKNSPSIDEITDTVPMP